MAATRLQALHGFRRLLRARKVLFRGDANALAASQLELRSQFQTNRHETDAAKIAEMLRGIDEVEDMMLNNFVQGELNEQGNYTTTIPSDSSGEELTSITTEDLEKMAAETSCSVTVNHHSANRGEEHHHH
uniref:Complex 1 LYR protein domain-containing protein n=1 Tax=Phaeomonas parva TaxID=124430 RepID=A0A7S1U0R5_9STRA|mmetsp:Transcript_24325/g.76259  ORF Transcript_24325/g.76259 Transcript_24325/m.76259 type:complete len:131 (+) Transcript_24325:44-436(+)